MHEDTSLRGQLTPQLFEALGLSFWAALWATALGVPAALLAATVLHRSRWQFLEGLLFIPLFWSPTVTGFLLLYGLSPNHFLGQLARRFGVEVVFTPLGTILACVAVSLPLAYQACLLGRASMNVEIEESAYVQGGDPLFATLVVLWPQMRSYVLVACLLVFARSMGEFGASIMVGGNMEGSTRTLPLAIYTYAESQQWRLAALGGMISAAVGILVYVWLRKLISRALP